MLLLYEVYFVNTGNDNKESTMQTQDKSKKQEKNYSVWSSTLAHRSYNTCITELLHIDNCRLKLILLAVSDLVKVSVAINSQMLCTGYCACK